MSVETSVDATNDGPDPEARRPWKRTAATVVIGLLVAAAVGVAGYFAGKEASGADKLRTELSSARTSISSLKDDASRIASDNSTLQSRVSDLQGQVGDLKDQVAAANDLKGGGGGGGGSVTAPDGSLQLGVAANVGELTLKPTAFEKVSTSGGAATFHVTLTAKNQGSSPKDPFCGGDGASLTDSEGRSFDGDSVLSDTTANCGDSLAPGLAATYKMKFRVPNEAKPAYVTLWDSDTGSFAGAEEGTDWKLR